MFSKATRAQAYKEAAALLESNAGDGLFDVFSEKKADDIYVMFRTEIPALLREVAKGVIKGEI